MTSAQLLVASIFILLFAALIRSKWQPTWLFAIAALACYALGYVETDELLSKAVNPGLATLIMLLMVSIGLEKVDWISGIGRSLTSSSYLLSLIRISGVTALLSAFLNNTAVVSVLANTLKNNGHHPLSKLLIPLSYAAILGGTTTLIGTSTNLIVNSFLLDAGTPGLRFFDFFAVGIVAACAGIMALMFSSRFLPAHPEESIEPDEYFTELRIKSDSKLIGKTVAENGMRNLESVFLVEIVRDGKLISPVPPYEVLEAGDVLIFSGDLAEFKRLTLFDGLESFALTSGLLKSNLTEVIVMPTATIVGKTIKDVGFRAMFDAAVVGMRRSGERLSGKLGGIVLRPGDSMLLAVGPDFASRQNIRKNFAVLNGYTIGRPLSNLACGLVLASFVLAVVLASLQILTLFKCLVLMLAGFLAAGIVSGDELKRRFPFHILIIIASALVLAQALSNTGLVDLIAQSLHTQLSSFGPFVALVGVYLATLLLTEMMTNNAAAALSFPIAFGLAQSFDVSWMPFVMAVAYGASASFLTPYGYTTNLMVQNICGYQLKDYVRTGLPVAVAYSITVILMLPIIFPF